jgi:hypothetical protein
MHVVVRVYAALQASQVYSSHGKSHTSFVLRRSTINANKNGRQASTKITECEWAGAAILIRTRGRGQMSVRYKTTELNIA